MKLALRKEFRYKFEDHRYSMQENKIKFYFLGSKADLYSSGFTIKIKTLYDSYNCNFIELHQDEIIVDVGANAGEFQFCLPKNKCIGIELLPLDYEILKLNRKTDSYILNICI
jgi:hypothetical protein